MEPEQPIDKVAIVTGASSGIGRAVARRLHAGGACVVLAARRKEQLEELRSELGERALCVPRDMTDDAQVSALIERTVETFGTLDILVNNAGTGGESRVMEANIKDWDLILDLNLRAVMVATRFALPHILKSSGGAVINISSVAGLHGMKGSAAYSASKFGVRGFTQALFEEVRENRVKVTSVFPGFVNTEMVAGSQKLDYSRMIQPEDLAEVVANIITASETYCPVEITVRPQRSPYL